jgi:hypothetical protein
MAGEKSPQPGETGEWRYKGPDQDELSYDAKDLVLSSDEWAARRKALVDERDERARAQLAALEGKPYVRRRNKFPGE